MKSVVYTKYGPPEVLQFKEVTDYSKEYFTINGESNDKKFEDLRFLAKLAEAEEGECSHNIGTEK